MHTDLLACIECNFGKDKLGLFQMINQCCKLHLYYKHFFKTNILTQPREIGAFTMLWIHLLTERRLGKVEALARKGRLDG